MDSQNITTAKVLGFSYNQIHIKENRKPTRSIYFEGLQKRVLSDFDEDILKRIKHIEFIDKEDFWNIGINLFVCCDKCGCALFSVCSDDDFNDKNICKNCEKWLCSSCMANKDFCEKCFNKQIAIKI